MVQRAFENGNKGSLFPTKTVERSVGKLAFTMYEITKFKSRWL